MISSTTASKLAYNKVRKEVESHPFVSELSNLIKNTASAGKRSVTVVIPKDAPINLYEYLVYYKNYSISDEPSKWTDEHVWEISWR